MFIQPTAFLTMSRSIFVWSNAINDAAPSAAAAAARIPLMIADERQLQLHTLNENGMNREIWTETEAAGTTWSGNGSHSTLKRI